ncbi:DUF6881 domain-containing protein [Nocardia salmonicida]|uniref:DUF6881 domain-containing protein n=1 Tax=Nocardia salmonicida TaxID=53431 RepID=UPI0037A47075
MSTGDRTSGDSAIVVQQGLLQDIVENLVYSTQDEWHRIDAVFVLVGDRSFFRVSFDSGCAEFSTPSLPAELPGSVRQLKDVMYVAGRGSWLTLYCSVSADGSFETSFVYDERPDVGEEIFRDLVKELELYPRNTVPGWIAAELGDDLPTVNADAFDRRHPHYAQRPRMDSELGPSDLYRPEMDRASASRLARGFVPEESGIEYFSITRKYVSERDPVMVFLELGDDRLEYRKIEVFPNGCVDSATLTSEGEYTLSRDEPWPSTSELLQEEATIAVTEITPEEFQTEWLIVYGS